MSDYIFLFDLDSTVTRREILPEIARKIGKYDEMHALTESAMRGESAFADSFTARVRMLASVPLEEARHAAGEIPLNECMADFIRRNSDRCYIATGNLDVWIGELMERLDMQGHCYCSAAEVADDRVVGIKAIADKEAIAGQLPHPLVVIGDGDNDIGMARAADVSVGFGGVHPIAPALLRQVDYAFYDDRACADFLWTLARNGTD